MLDGYDFDCVFIDEQSEFPPRDADLDALSQQLKELAEKLGETLSALGEYLQRAFAQVGDALRERMELLSEIVPKKRQVFKLVKKLCMLSPRKASHRELIPYYTGGFL